MARPGLQYDLVIRGYYQDMKRLFFGILLAGASTGLAAAEIYRWVDASGVVNYTQQKPRDMDSQKVTTDRGATRVVTETPAPAETPTASPMDELSDAQRAMLKDLQAAELARQAEVTKIREDNCEKSRSVLSRLSATQRIRVNDDSGNQRIMPEDERQRRIEEAQLGIAQNCDAA